MPVHRCVAMRALGEINAPPLREEISCEAVRADVIGSTRSSRASSSLWVREQRT